MAAETNSYWYTAWVYLDFLTREDGHNVREREETKPIIRMCHSRPTYYILPCDMRDRGQFIFLVLNLSLSGRSSVSPGASGVVVTVVAVVDEEVESTTENVTPCYQEQCTAFIIRSPDSRLLSTILLPLFPYCRSQNPLLQKCVRKFRLV